MSHRVLRILAVVALVALGGCATKDTPNTTASNVAGLTLSVVEPKDGQTVHLPFQIKVKSNEKLGRAATGVYHIHIWFDNNPADYNMIESDTGEITSATAGPHTLHVSLNYANHDPTGVETSVDINIANGPGAASPTDDDDSGYPAR
jgi:hypothetical protein